MDITSTINNKKAIKLKAMHELVEGQEFTSQLQKLLFQPGSSGLGPAEDLAAKILGSFSTAISVLDSSEPISPTSSLVAAVEGSQNASCDSDVKFEDSGDSRKRLGPVKGKRGCYKRKKRSETWTVESTVLEDAFCWRKYGQKQILNTKFPRSYFRCTHKYTQGCKATKQVQKLEHGPMMFNITYIGNHTCNTSKETPNIKPCNHHLDEIIMNSEEHKSPSLTTSVKDEEENHNSSPPTANDLSLVWQDIVFEENPHHHEAIYGCAENSGFTNVMVSTDLVVFGARSDFGFSDNEQLSYFDSCSSLS